MTKIAIISQPDTGMLIDVGGCSNAQEAAQHLSSTFQDPTRFWESNQIDISLGKLALSEDDATQFANIITERGVRPRTVFSDLEATRLALASVNVTARDTTAVDCSPAPRKSSTRKSSAARKSSEMVISIAVPGGQPDSWVAKAGATNIELDNLDGEQEDDESTDPDATPSTPLPVVGQSITATVGAAPAAKPAPHVTPAVLYLHQTLRSGQTVNHKGNLVIVGDVNPGAEVIAEGDILIWGALRGIAHAGSAGNEEAEIRALRLQPIQLRIAQAIARAPDRPRGKPSTPGPELARVVDGQIRISYNAPE